MFLFLSHQKLFLRLADLKANSTTEQHFRLESDTFQIMILVGLGGLAISVVELVKFVVSWIHDYKFYSILQERTPSEQLPRVGGYIEILFYRITLQKLFQVLRHQIRLFFHQPTQNLLANIRELVYCWKRNELGIQNPVSGTSIITRLFRRGETQLSSHFFTRV